MTRALAGQVKPLLEKEQGIFFQCCFAENQFQSPDVADVEPVPEGVLDDVPEAAVVLGGGGLRGRHCRVLQEPPAAGAARGHDPLQAHVLALRPLREAEAGRRQFPAPNFKFVCNIVIATKIRTRRAILLYTSSIKKEKS